MIKLVGKDKCTGCSACFNACKFDALSMETDETGFWFPKIDEVKCVECGACMRACPALEKPEYKSENPKAYIVQNKDDEIRRQSTSGGAFTAIAKTIIAQDGVVFGAAIDGDYKVSHIWVDTEEGLARFRSSKYVQSWIGESYREAERFLKIGRMVCFSGTPCQIYGLKKYLGQDYENLLTVDVMCRAVPSPKVLEKYLEFQKIRYMFNRISFRDKKLGYSQSTLALYQDEKCVYRGSSEYDPWLRLFLGSYCDRLSCYNCKYQGCEHISDFTLWDCWNAYEYNKGLDDNKGTTHVVVWSSSGLCLLQSILTNFSFEEIEFEKILGMLERKNIREPKKNRDVFFQDLKDLGAKEFFHKYAPITIKVRIFSAARKLLHLLHLHDVLRRYVHNVRKKR